MAVALAAGGAGVAAGQSAVAGHASAGLVQRGSQGSAVAAVQRALGMTATGFFGQDTEARVRAFQRSHGLVVDGIVGPQTSAALGLGGASGDGGQGSQPAPASSGSASTALESIARCESGGNPHAIGGAGEYRGKYQFTYETWRAVGGRGDPAAASEAEQDRRAAILYARSGASSWPSCG